MLTTPCLFSIKNLACGARTSNPGPVPELASSVSSPIIHSILRGEARSLRILLRSALDGPSSTSSSEEEEEKGYSRLQRSARSASTAGLDSSSSSPEGSSKDAVTWKGETNAIGIMGGRPMVKEFSPGSSTEKFEFCCRI